MDGVELHAANGYIFEQFLNRSSNQRTDEYGGTIENRARFLHEVVDAVSAAIGSDRLGVRISPFGVLNDISDPDPQEIYTHVLSLLDRLGVAYLHMIRPAVSGNQDSEAGQALPDPVRDVRKWCRGRTIVAGGLEVAEADAMVGEGVADAIAFGRWFVSNPDLPERLKNGWPLNEFDRPTFYTQGPLGYIDYPSFAADG
jgi:N-ethylmaleimide reductase